MQKSSLRSVCLFGIPFTELRELQSFSRSALCTGKAVSTGARTQTATKNKNKNNNDSPQRDETRLVVAIQIWQTNVTLRLGQLHCTHGPHAHGEAEAGRCKAFRYSVLSLGAWGNHLEVLQGNLRKVLPEVFWRHLREARHQLFSGPKRLIALRQGTRLRKRGLRRKQCW